MLEIKFVATMAGAALALLAFAATAPSASAQPGPGDPPPYVEELTPSPEESEIVSLVAGKGGRLLALGESLYRRTGGGWRLPLLLEKEGPGAEWVEIPTPNFGMAPGQFHTMNRLTELPGGDLLALGHYNPDPSSGRFRAIMMHYRRATEEWTLNEVPAPDPDMSTSLSDAAVDPFDPDRVLVVGLTLNTRVCYSYISLVLEYRPSLGTYRMLPISTAGDLRRILPRADGTFMALGTNINFCSFGSDPVILRIEGEQAFGIPGPPLGMDLPQRTLTGAAALPSGDIIVVGFSSETGLGGFRTLSHLLDPATLHWRTLEPLNPTDFLKPQLFDVAVSPDGRAHAVGRYTYTYDERFFYGPLIQTFDGESWRIEEVPPYLTAKEFTRANTQLWGVAAMPDGAIYTGGQYYNLNPPRVSRTILLRQDASGCYADCDGDGSLDFFDFLCFQNEFAAATPYADCDESGALDFFDFLCFQNAFAAGCP